MTRVNFVEHYIIHQDKLKELSPAKLRFFWAQRTWHPVLRMRWLDSIESDGKGTLTFPDGSKYLYNGTHDAPE